MIETQDRVWIKGSKEFKQQTRDTLSSETGQNLLKPMYSNKMGKPVQKLHIVEDRGQMTKTLEKLPQTSEVKSAAFDYNFRTAGEFDHTKNKITVYPGSISNSRTIIHETDHSNFHREQGIKPEHHDLPYDQRPIEFRAQQSVRNYDKEMKTKQYTNPYE